MIQNNHSYHSHQKDAPQKCFLTAVLLLARWIDSKMLLNPVLSMETLHKEESLCVGL